MLSKLAATNLNPVQFNHFVVLNNFTAGKASVCINSEKDTGYNSEIHSEHRGSKKKLYRRRFKGRYNRVEFL